MLSNREITENFEVQINTLYNWRKTKPKLYRYLRNADYNFEQSKEINILLERFAKEIKPGFTVEEILFFMASEVEVNAIDEIEQLERVFLLSQYRSLPKESQMLLSVYDALHAMGIIEKYIFYKRAYHLRAEQKRIDRETITEYFAEFLCP